MADTQVKEMLDSALHFGHQTKKWNPKMKKFLYGSKNGIHIFDLDKTVLYLVKALEYLKLSAANGKTILFVSTKPQAAHIILKVAGETKMPYVIHKWMAGLFTNFSTMKKRIKYFNDLLAQEKSGELEKYTKKEIAKFKKEIVKLEAALGGVRSLERLPDIVFVADVVRDKIVVKEANKMKIPVVAIVDSNADPDGIACIIPANDDAVGSISYILGKVEKSILEGRSSKSK